METTNRIIYLLRQHIGGTLDTSERVELDKWVAQHPAVRRLLEEVSDDESLVERLATFDAVYEGDEAASVDRMWKHISKGLHKTPRTPKMRRLLRWIPYAAAVILGLSAILLLRDRSREIPRPEVAAKRDLLPGGNKATLTLADGRTVMLQEKQNGIVVGDEITYLDGKKVLDGAGLRGREPSEAVLTTPRGGTYQVTLPDGSRVWLNAATSLKYPTRFEKEKRVVELSGEAYFDIIPLEKSGKRQPFVVKTAGQAIEVLGTQFNVSAYVDESEVRTTLVEGSVRVGGSSGSMPTMLLRPGQQSTIRNGKMRVRDVDVRPYIAWKEGVFHFDDTPFDAVMRQIARWYNVEVVYRNGIPKESFSGKIRRDVTINGVLDLLRASDVNVVLDGATIVIN